jgi:AraC family transcriptional regulator
VNTPSDSGGSGGTGGRPDRLRELLDAVLDEPTGELTCMAGQAHASPFHFARQVSRDALEPPVALRRRVTLERACWRLRSGDSVTDTAWEAGFDSVEGFSRAYRKAYGYPPSQTPSGWTGGTGHWLPAPNGIHFHTPDSLWIESGEAGENGDDRTVQPADQVTGLLVNQDLGDLRNLLESSRRLSAEAWERIRLPGHVLLHWAGPEESVAVLLERAVAQYETWLASVNGTQVDSSTDQVSPDQSVQDELLTRLDEVAPRWSELVADVSARGAWADRIVDAICEPPESFVIGSIIAHVVSYNAQRRGLVRSFLRQDGVLEPDDDGDPIMWLRGGRGGTSPASG